MSAIELTAKTLEEAQRNAAEKLGVSPDQVTVTVLEEVKGLFGKNSLRVSAEVIASAAPVVAEAPTAEKKSASRGRGKAAAPKEEEAPVAVEAAPEAVAPKGRGKRVAAPKAEDAAPAEAESNGDNSEDEVVIEATEDDGAKIVEFIEEVIEASGLEITAKLNGLQGRYVNVSLDGKDASFLVGKHGEVLNSLQYITNIVSGRKLGLNARATIECNDYRRRREETLTKLAARIAAEVRDRGEEAVLDALPAFERRIVHKAIQEMEGVSTYSEGEEPNRRVVIAPA